VIRTGVHQAAGPLLERDAELAAIGAVLDGARAGGGGLVVVEGAPGIGKSRLLEAAAAHARARGMQVLRGRGGVAETALPFGVAQQLFSPAVAALDDAALDRVLAGAAELAVPLLAPRAGGGGGRRDRARTGDHRALASLVHGLHWLAANLAAERPAALVVDDAHWADPASLRALAYLAEHVDELPVAIVAGTRPGGAGERPEPLEHLLGHRVATVVRPGALTPRAVAALVRDAWPAQASAALCAACAKATGGNPFLLGELLRTLRAEDRPPDPARVARLEPASIARAVLRRIAALDDDGAAALAVAAAVLGDDVRLADAAALAGLDPDGAAAAAAALTGASVLARAEPVVFAHPLVRAAVLREVGADERQGLHLRAAALLHDAGAPAERVAAQLAEVPRSGRPWAADALRAAAGQALERGVPEIAARHLARLLAEPLDDERRAGTLLDLGRVRLMSGDPETRPARSAPAATSPCARCMASARRCSPSAAPATPPRPSATGSPRPATARRWRASCARSSSRSASSSRRCAPRRSPTPGTSPGCAARSTSPTGRCWRRSPPSRSSRSSRTRARARSRGGRSATASSSPPRRPTA